MLGRGTRAQHIYAVLRTRIEDMQPGAQLSTLTQLVAEFGVAPMTVRPVLARLEEEGYLIREQGRGTFVLERHIPTVLVVDDEAAERRLLNIHITRLGFRTVEATGRAAGIAVLEQDPGIALVLSDVRMPERDDGIAFIRTVRQRWPKIPLAAVTGYPDDLSPLHGTPDCPIMIIPKPVWAHYIEEVLRLALHT